MTILYDDFQSDAGWTTEGNVTKSFIDSSKVMVIFSLPANATEGGGFSGGGLRKDYKLPFMFGAAGEVSWLHFRFQTHPLLGANMYTTLYVDEPKRFFMHFGLNGAQGWRGCGYGDTSTGACASVFALERKPYLNAAFFGAKGLVVPDGMSEGDISANTFGSIQKPTDHWYLWSVRLDRRNNQAKLAWFLDGFRIADFRPFGDVPEVVTSDIPAIGYDSVAIGCGVLIDPPYRGANWNDKEFTFGSGDIYGLNAYTDISPSEPSRRPHIPDSEINNAPQWMTSYPIIRWIISKGESSLEKLTWDRIFNAKSAKFLGLDVAVILGVIPTPPANHVQWSFGPPGERDRIVSLLQSFGHVNPDVRAKPMEFATQLAWQYLRSGFARGGNAQYLTALAVHFGCLSATSVRKDQAQMGAVSAEEKALIPELPSPQTSVMEWDFLSFGKTSANDTNHFNELNVNTSGRLEAGILDRLKNEP